MRKKIFVYSLVSIFLLVITTTTTNAKGIKEKVADSYYTNLAYKKAVSYYVELADSKKATAEIVRKTADCYNKIGDSGNAIKWYNVLAEKDWATKSDLYEQFLLLRKTGAYDKSITVMNDYLNNGGQETEFIKYLKENPNYVAELEKKNKDKYTLKNLDFNSDEHDFGATFYENGIVYATPEKTGKRVNINRKFAWDNTNFLQLYYVEKNEEGYSFPEKFTLASRDKYHDGPIAFNSDYTEAYLTRSNYSASGKLGKSEKDIVEINLYTSERNEKGEWSELTPLPFNSDEYSTGCATISKEGDIMIFASDMPGGKGQTDLWMSKRVNGEWQTPVPLGDKINTERRDNYPWLDKDGNLYFASDGGLQGLGGYDVFWIPGFLQGRDKVYNVGFPINSEADDFGFIYNSDNATGYFNTGRKGVKGDKGCDDIYTFEKLVSLLEVQVVDKETQEPIITAKGCLRSEFNDPIEADIKLDNEAKFSKELVTNTYIACAVADGYHDGTVKIVLPKGKFVTVVVELEKIKEVVVEEVPCPEITLEDIFYDFDKYAIRDDASTSLDELVVFLNEYPTTKINLVSHTDSRGTKKYNQWLSQKRAESAIEYLVSKGIARERISGHGEGENMLINKCADGVPCSKREHQANRRTTVEIISSDCIEVNKKTNKYVD